MGKIVKVKFTRECGQATPNRKAPKNEDVPRKNYNPKEMMDKFNEKQVDDPV